MYRILNIFILILLMGYPSVARGWSPPFRVSPYNSNDISPAVCVDGEGRVWVTWFNPRRLYSRSYFEGVWSEVMLVDTTPTTYGEVVRSSAMCRDTLGQVWVTWVDSIGFIRMSYFESRNQVWCTIAQDSAMRGASPGITCDRLNNIWCSWTGFTSLLDSNFYFMASCYDGNNWTRFDTLATLAPLMMVVTTGITTDISGYIWVCSGSVYAQYFDGIDWSMREDIAYGGRMALPTICADSSGGVWVAYSDKMHVRCAEGDTWSSAIQFPHSDTTYGGWPHSDICSDPQGGIWAGFSEARSYGRDTIKVCGAYYQNGEWHNPTVIDIPSFWGHIVYPVNAYGADKVWLVWENYRQGYSNVYLSYTSVQGVEEDDNYQLTISNYQLSVHPNPSRDNTVISYELRVTSNGSNDKPVTNNSSLVTLSIYDLSGRLIRRFTIDDLRFTSITWDGRDGKGKEVKSGIYFVRLEIGKDVKTRKLVLVN